MTSSHLLLHRVPKRLEFYSSAAPLFWSDQLECWITADRDLVVSIFKDKRFAVVDLKGEVRKLSQKLAIDFHATEDMLDQTALGLEGPEHVAARRKSALIVRQNSEEALRAFANVLEEKVGSLFNNQKAFNIVLEVIAPAVKALMSSLSGVEEELSDSTFTASQVFDRKLSANRRKRIEKWIGSALGRRPAECPFEDRALQTSLSVVGSDSVLGSLSESFVHEIEGNIGKPMSQIEWSERLPMTGVPYIERISSTSVAVAGMNIEKGQRIRLLLDALRPERQGDTDNYFGAGRHICVGKAVALQAWRTLTIELAKIDKRVRVTSVQYRESDYLFNAPKIVEVVVDHD